MDTLSGRLAPFVYRGEPSTENPQYCEFGEGVDTKRISCLLTPGSARGARLPPRDRGAVLSIVCWSCIPCNLSGALGRSRKVLDSGGSTAR